MRSGTTGNTVTGVVTIVVVGYALAMALVAVAVATTGDSNALGMLLLFGPRWLLVFPWLLLVPLAFRKSWWLVLTALVGATVTLFSVSGFEVPTLSALRTGAGGGKTLRVVTYNADRSIALASRIVTDMLAWDADVIVMQDCAPEVRAAMQTVSSVADTKYQLYSESEFCVATRLPSALLERSTGSRNAGRAFAIQVTWEGTPVDVFTVHLPSPRNALWAARKGSADLLEQSVEVRSTASAAIAQWALANRGGGAVIVAGDFNLPVESRALGRDWSSLRNAFSEAGWGFGHTMFAGRHRVRIDHVLVSPAFTVRRARVLSGYPSEHQPVVVELAIITR